MRARVARATTAVRGTGMRATAARVTGIVLAAGQSRRMGRPKLSLELISGMRLGEPVLEAMLCCGGLAGIVAVVRPEDDRLWTRRAEERDREGRLTIVPCAEAVRGQAYSLRYGLRQARRQRADAVLIALADQPFVGAALLGELLDTFCLDGSLDYAACRNGSRAHPPAVFGASMFEALARLEGDAGARTLMADGRWRGALLAPRSPLAFVDVDTPSDLQAASAYAAPSGDRY